MHGYSDFLRVRMEHVYTEEEIDKLYRVVEEAACVAWLMRMYQEMKRGGREMLKEYDIDRLNPRPNPYANGMKSAYKQWQENYVRQAVSEAVSTAVQDTTNDIIERITDNLVKQHPEWTREKARAHAEALISV